MTCHSSVCFVTPLSTEGSESLAKLSWARHYILGFPWKVWVCYLIHKRLSLVPNMSQMNPFHVHRISLRSVSVFASRLCFGLPGCYFSSVFHTKALPAFLFTLLLHESKTVTLGRPLVRSVRSSCVLFFGQVWGNRWNPLSFFDPPVFNSWNHGKGRLRKDISYSSGTERHRMRMGKGRVQQIGEEILRLSISFHDVPTLSPSPTFFLVSL